MPSKRENLIAEVERLKDYYRKLSSDKLRVILASPYSSHKTKACSLAANEILRERAEETKDNSN